MKGALRSRQGSGRAKAAPFSAAVFVGAALAFLVEPMLARLALPLFGGTPAVWTGSVLFFQAALLAGYLYAHATIQWLGARRGAALHLAVALLPLAFLPIAVPEGFSPPAGAEPLPWLLGLLAASAGLPFFVASATSTLVQGWLAATDHPSAKDPYFLYAASNLGSILGLLAYPLILEPALGLEAQGRAWAAGYAVLLLLLVACAATLWRSPRTGDAPAGDVASPAGGASDEPRGPSVAASPTLRRRLGWLALAFVPSSLMLGVTAFVTTDVAPFPLLWAVPLALYLGSFVVVFSPNPRVLEGARRFSARALPAAMVALVVLVLVGAQSPFWLVTGLHLAGFFVAALSCHGELAKGRPHPRYLTGFYAWIATGGLLGGVFNALVAPLAFDYVVEYPLAIVLACFFLPRFSRDGRDRAPALPPWWPDPRVLDVALPLAAGLWVAVILWIAGYADGDGRELLRTSALSVGLGLCLYFAYSSLRRRPVRFALALGAVALAGSLLQAAGDGDGEERVLYAERSFFGAYRVEAEGDYHRLMNGTTLHGSQDLGDDPPAPLTYYAPEGPAGQIVRATRRSGPDGAAGLRRAAVVGLGTGSMACHAEEGERWTFYEVDPVAERVARNPRLFTYLGDCPGEHGVVLGDARLSLERALDEEYGLIAVDAFSSDAIPTHLLTREATRLYFQKLGDGGILALHVSNRHLDLEPVLGNLARDAGLACRARTDDGTEPPAEGPRPRSASHWVTMARDADDLGPLDEERGWAPCSRAPGSQPWTDDHSDPLGALR